ncbi:unnamed protein product [Sphenostylis stenocarpa]|uniref:Uncharacterized protein n=1 Tax=Sphenostylis stenocarpa TaxID=92480 RepID=A0AA86VAE3_9FABA|nr:unnamed protein product [Sphenostylis stenocarpa]
MEGHDSWNAVECLRGRLLAERQASRVANEQAESMCNKQFNELEKMLKEEIKLRDKAERKLKLLKKKLECFTPSWQKRHAGEKCEHFCGSSLCSAACTSRDSEANETKAHTVNPALLENEVHNHNVAQEHVLVQTHNSPFTTKDCDSLLSDDTSSCDSDLCKTPNQSPDNLKKEENRLSVSSSKSSPVQAPPEIISHNPNPR